MKNNLALKTLFTLNGIFVLAGSLLGPLYAVYVETFTNGVVSISVSWAVFLISSSLTTWLMAKYGDRVREKEDLMMAGFLIRAICWLAYIFVGNLWELMLVQFVLGIGDALGTPAFNAVFAEHLDKGQQIREYSDWTLISNILLAIGTLLGGVIAENYGFKTVFVIMSSLAFISLIGLLSKPRKLL